MKILLVNASAPSYNLAISKARNYWTAKGATVREATEVPSLFMRNEGFDLVWISVIFSWHVPNAIRIAQEALRFSIPTEIGGCGTFGLQQEIYEATGIRPQARPDHRFERQPGSYKMVFWSRGCPAKNCSLGFPHDGRPAICSVPEMEGWRFTLYNDVTPARIILDNNLSALPKQHQELIIDRTLAEGFTSVDANSGFEPRSFKPETCERWLRLPLAAWRFAYDELSELPAVTRMMEILDDYGVSRKARHIYCLAGNEPIEACEERVKTIVQWKSVAIVQRRRPLNWQGEDILSLPTLYDWTPQKLIDFQRWGNRLSGAFPFSAYRRGMKDGDALTEPLAFL